jgi:uncharacterized protein
MTAAGNRAKAYSLSEGELLVRAARNAMELYLTSSNFRREAAEMGLSGFGRRHGVFVTIYHYPTRTLRGCIGFTEGVKPLGKLIVDAAVSAATEDPRFVPLSPPEFGHIVIEVSLLTEPEKISGDPSEIRKQVRIGKDGLMIEYGYNRGLLLPIVAVEEGWGAEEFLDNVCIKAGMAKQTWRQRGVSLYRFSAQVFAETEPRGRVTEVRLEES